ncbi:MAG: Flp family type IVb pilin [Bosea sp. (in: a-proteobacteria)]|uniref:Flp family type IVb pilin n=1 Tax=unclassified Bosea (in: a-proteobacteria) TaxID=2653178 RepID=UPI000AD604CB|nr:MULTISPECIES: Flp family type IVb pilin [unclassified Bosea (in: a-proteobacteria)]MBN9458736.1 Flp family type IVb pilin [Bosea sp. (in: a-proteobacteria)]
MERIVISFEAFRRDERGATMIEYGFIVSLISLTIIASATLIGQSVTRFFQSMAAGFGP